MMSTIDDLNHAGGYTRHMKHMGPDACRAWQLLIRFSIEQRTQLPPLAAEFDLSLAQCHVLHAIEPGRPMPMGQLACRLACDASNVTGLVDRLEGRGLIRRHPSAEDRRVKVLDLTPTGARLRTQIVDRLGKPPEVLGRLSDRDHRTLVRILTRLLD
jgi:DNA-binding MarR family transcriptional regulator